jgi:hypothetical protein
VAAVICPYTRCYFSMMLIIIGQLDGARSVMDRTSGVLILGIAQDCSVQHLRVTTQSVVHSAVCPVC